MKPSHELKGAESIRVRKGAVYFTWEVLEFPRSRMAAAKVPEFARDITPESEKRKLEEIREAQRDLIRPVGRPTKRDRRDWERYFE